MSGRGVDYLKEGNKAIRWGALFLYPLMNEQGENATYGYTGCKNAAEMHEEMQQEGNRRRRKTEGGIGEVLRL